MATRKYKYGLKCDPKELFNFLKPKAEKKGYRLDGDAQSGTFSDPYGFVSGAYEVRGNTVFVTIECSVDSLWGKIEKELNGLFG